MILRDPAYLVSLREERCLITGRRADSECSVVPSHVGTLGKSLKTPDHEAIPIRADMHHLLHNMGEPSFYRAHLRDDVLVAAVRALAREDYRRWKQGAS